MYETLLEKSRKMAQKAKPGIMKIGDDIYTFEFDQKEWIYVVYENMSEYVRFNTKSLSQAKKWLVEWKNN